MRLCREHFQEDVQRKAREYLRQTGLFSRSARIMIDLDGGRNSSALAYILKNTFQRRRDIDLQAVTIEEGEGESQSSREAARVAEQLEIPVFHLSLPPLSDQDASDINQSTRKRDALLGIAQEKGAGIIAMTQDLDEEALEIFLRYLQGDCNGYAGGEEGMHWIKPLRRIPKREVRLYALSLGLGWDRITLPRSDRLKEVAKRMLFEFDSRHPGTNYSLLRGWERLLGPAGKGAKPLSKDIE